MQEIESENTLVAWFDDGVTRRRRWR